MTSSLVDEKHTPLVDSPTTIYSLDAVRNAKAVASVVEKLYGTRLSITEVLRENALHNQSSEGQSQDVRHRP